MESENASNAALGFYKCLVDREGRLLGKIKHFTVINTTDECLTLSPLAGVSIISKKGVF